MFFGSEQIDETQDDKNFELHTYTRAIIFDTKLIIYLIGFDLQTPNGHTEFYL